MKYKTKTVDKTRSKIVEDSNFPPLLTIYAGDTPDPDSDEECKPKQRRNIGNNIRQEYLG